MNETNTITFDGRNRAHGFHFPCCNQFVVIACRQLDECFISTVFCLANYEMNAIDTIQYVDTIEIVDDFLFLCKPWETTGMYQILRLVIFGLYCILDIILRFRIAIAVILVACLWARRSDITIF